MMSEIKQRIEQVHRGEVPVGYKRTGAGIVPNDWKEYRLGDIYTERNEPGRDDLPILMVSIHSGVSDGEVDEEDMPKTVKRIEDKSAYKCAYSGDLVFNMMRAWQGAIGTVRTDGMVSPAYIVAKPNEMVDPLFMDDYMKSNRMINATARQSYGVTDFRLRLYWDSFTPIECAVPPMSEQRKIVEIVSACNKVIELKQELVDELKKLKKVCLEKMFPQKGSSVPEIRFSGFTAPWEQRKLGDAACVIGGNAWKSTDYSDSGEYLVVTIANVSGDVFINDAVGNHLSCDNPEGYLLDENDILVSLTGNVGRVSKMTRIQGLLNQRVGKIVPNSSDVNAGFLFHVLRNPCFEKAMIDAGQGAAQKNISNSDVLNYSFLLPVDKDEQASIACYFDELDNLITLHQRELEAEQQKKKALMKLLLTGIVRTNP